MAMSDARPQPGGMLSGGAEADARLARACAVSCRMYEDGPGPARYNVGTELEPRLVERREAWREFYARYLLVELEADRDRIAAAAVGCHRLLKSGRCRAILARALPVLRRHEHQPERDQWRHALDLCQRAGGILAQSGADQDESTRRRLLAGTRHQLTLQTFGAVPGVAAASAARLVEELHHLGADEQT